MRLQLGLLILPLLLPLSLRAETDIVAPDTWRLCPILNDPESEYSPPPVFSADHQQEIRISARQVENTGGDVSIFDGDVLIERDGLRLQAARAIFKRPQQKVELEGPIHVDTRNMGINASEGWLDIDQKTGEFSDTEYVVPGAHIRGSAPLLSAPGDNRTLLVDSSFTSCPQQKQDWHLNTALLRLDHETDEGTAKHAVLWFKGVPVFYSPYISFPLGDARRSGFLMPGFGTSSSRGFELSIPWYWNIAPNQDATFTPTYMRKRGTLLGTDYRYLTRSSRGELNLEYLDEDRLLEQERYLIRYSQHSDIGKATDLDVIINDASDNDYLDDMASNITVSNITHLERRATLKYGADSWNMRLMGQTYETIDDTIALNNRPYRRLPQVTLTGSEDLFDSGIHASLNSEWVDFEHESDNREQGQRFHAYPKLSWPMQGSAWFIKPALGLHHTQYSVTDTTGTELVIEDRNLAIGSLDAGLFFERNLDNNTLQTLEPRIFYLNIPYEDQSNIPLFDTGELSFSFAQLFRENRFSGIDRVGDTNQLTLGITSRLLDSETGHEHMSASIGQIYYYEDRRVSLDNATARENKSDIISELGAGSRNWSGRATIQWDPQTHQSDKRSMQLHYEDQSEHIFNIAYRYQRDPLDETNDLEQGDISFSWPVSPVYTVMARWNYSLTDERDIETLIALEHDSCCWTMRILAQRYLTDDVAEPYDTSVMFQLILKGLGSVHGKKVTNTLKHAILGYQSEY